MTDRAEKRTIEYSDSFTVHVCEHGNLCIQLIDKAGEIFAVAPMDRATAFVMIERVMDGFSNPSPCEGIH